MPNIFDKIRGFCDIIYVFLMIMYETILTKKKAHEYLIKIKYIFY
jgi:hypothetical protein